MELKPDYKKTVVGVIPEEWEIVSIGSLVSFSSGKRISIADLHEQSINFSVPVFGGNGISGYANSSIVHEPTVVVGRVGQKCGEVYTSNCPVWVTDNALYPKRLYRALNIRFFGVALKMAGLNNVKNRNDLPLVTQSILHSVQIAWPPNIAEQEAIAEALSDADALIESLGKLIAKKRQIKQGAMQELLRPKDGWVEIKLGSLGSFLKGSGVRKDESLSGDLACIRYGEIYTKHSDLIKSFYSWISSEVAASARRLKVGDLLFAGSGETKEEIGKCVAFVHDLEAYAGGDIVILRPERANSIFLGYYLNSAPVNRQKASKGQGDAVVHISSASLSSIEVTIPSLSEQTTIATILSDMDTEIAALEAKLAKARQVKQGMMHELLTGRIRLV